MARAWWRRVQPDQWSARPGGDEEAAAPIRARAWPRRPRASFFLLKIAAAEVSTDGMEPDEREYRIGYRWWSAAELAAATEPFYPVALPELLARIS